MLNCTTNTLFMVGAEVDNKPPIFELPISMPGCIIYFMWGLPLRLLFCRELNKIRLFDYVIFALKNRDVFVPVHS